MARQASSSDVSAFLQDAKILLSTGRFTLIPRKKNMQTLARYGWTIADVKDEILGLVVTDYYKGPKQDLDAERPGDIWEFKKEIDGGQFYVKLKISPIGSGRILKCLSFHEDDFA